MSGLGFGVPIWQGMDSGNALPSRGIWGGEVMRGKKCRR